MAYLSKIFGMVAVLILGTGTLCVNLPRLAWSQSINAGQHTATDTLPFVSSSVAKFNHPWAIAFLPDGRMLVTEKPGHIYLVTQSGKKTRLDNVPKVHFSGQNGLLDIAPAPDFATSSTVYLSYVEPDPDGSRLALARATLFENNQAAALKNLSVIWHQIPGGGGGQPGGIIAFDPDGAHLFLSVGDRMRPHSAQNSTQARGKVLRLKLDGTTPQDNPQATRGGILGQTWTTGHRNAYGLAFAADGRLWSHEMGPRGGDEFNLIEPGNNYGWPEVSNGRHYSGWPIPDHDTRPEFTPPPLYWTPVIAPAGLVFYEGNMFKQWQGSALIGGLATKALIRVDFNADGQPFEADRWSMKARVRDVAEAPDGAIWIIEDDSPGQLRRLTPR